MKLKSMPPVLKGEPLLLILGSMPGSQSLEKQQYYANPRNQFWKMLSDYFRVDLTALSYESRKSYVASHRIALWDILQECERIGSLDSAIRRESFNPISEFIEANPSILAIGCNGTKAFQSLKKYEKEKTTLQTPAVKLPSTSPVPGKNVLSYTEKCDVWHTFIHQYLKGAKS
ncbi:DNA-deoxyinosine glycosylase [Salisediminibacterium beveridgei]|uniref:G:T/U mismatch-specific uracil/thymine DNA-glycosylase n=1 Tax=Salisediminibacterium beveridgei TaxID=632773 RepID=A0A1D7QVK4_9BACI|nr:DNA-deoxyinosine glycosylase [Salisediminibacterium beveridgei]AOM82988.1 G:T/U mismatch-specific uracil/thymine DNA-glycosylase [Salisediminibacterium beveridgei]